MKYFIKRLWIVLVVALIINIPLLIFSTFRTDNQIILKGDTTIVENFVEIENSHQVSGTFSTIYVISVEHSSILQNFLVKNNDKALVMPISKNFLHFNDAELTQMAKIQHESSIMYSLILAYQEAKKQNASINLEYKFDGYVISYYDALSMFRIGDKIIGVNGIYAKDDFLEFKKIFNNASNEDEYNVIRSGKEIVISASSDNQKVSGYAYYTFDEATAFPKYKIKKTNVGGPSGGLLQTLALYNFLISEDITKGRRIAGTGTISPDGTVGKIGGIQQKIYTAYDDNMEIFLCPEENYEEALIAYNKLKNKEKMKLFSIKNFLQALEVLQNE